MGLVLSSKLFPGEPIKHRWELGSRCDQRLTAMLEEPDVCFQVMSCPFSFSVWSGVNGCNQSQLWTHRSFFIYHQPIQWEREFLCLAVTSQHKKPSKGNVGRMKSYTVRQLFSFIIYCRSLLMIRHEPWLDHQTISSSMFSCSCVVDPRVVFLVSGSWLGFHGLTLLFLVGLSTAPSIAEEQTKGRTLVSYLEIQEVSRESFLVL